MVSVDPAFPARNTLSVRDLDSSSKDRLDEWLNDQHVPDPLQKENLHCSVVCATTSIPPSYVPDEHFVHIDPPFSLGRLGPAFVLFFRCPLLEEQWRNAKQHGVDMKYAEFVPHISLSYKFRADWNYSSLQPPDFAFTLTSEILRSFDPTFKNHS